MSYSSIVHSIPVHAVEEISMSNRPSNTSTIRQKTRYEPVNGKMDPMLDNYTRYQEYIQEHPSMMTNDSNHYHPLQPSKEEAVPLEELPVKKLLGRKFPQRKRQWVFRTEREMDGMDALHFKVLLMWMLVFALYYYFR